MSTEVIVALTLSALSGAVLGFLLGRFAGGGWLFALLLGLGLIASGLMSDTVLTALGIPNENWGHLGYAAFAMFILMPAMAGGLVAGGFGLWRAARAQTRTERG